MDDQASSIVKRRRVGTSSLRLKTPLTVLSTYLPSCHDMAQKLMNDADFEKRESLLDKSLIRNMLESNPPDTTAACRNLTSLYLQKFDLNADVFHMKKVIQEETTSSNFKIPKHIKGALRGVRNKASEVDASLLPEIRQLFVRTLMNRAIEFMANALCFYEKTHGIRLSKTDATVLESAVNRPHRVSYWAIKKVYDNNVAQWEQKHQQFAMSLKNSTSVPDREPISKKSKRLQKQIFNVFIEGSWLQRYDELKILGAQEAMRRLSAEWASDKAVQTKWGDITKLYNTQLAQEQVTPESKETQKKLLNVILQESTPVSA